MEEGRGVEDTIGQISDVQAGEAVDRAGVASKLERVWVLVHCQNTSCQPRLPGIRCSQQRIRWPRHQRRPVPHMERTRDGGTALRCQTKPLKIVQAVTYPVLRHALLTLEPFEVTWLSGHTKERLEVVAVQVAGRDVSSVIAHQVDLLDFSTSRTCSHRRSWHVIGSHSPQSCRLPVRRLQWVS